MNIYSSTLSAENLHSALHAVPGLGFENYDPLLRPRLAARGWNILLYRSGSHTAFAKGCGDHGHGAASWTDYGYYLTELYETDPDMKVRGSANYDSAADFHRQTRYAFQGERQPGVTPLQVTRGRGRPVHLREDPDFRPATSVTRETGKPLSLAAELSEQATWLEEGADEHEAGNDAVDLAGRARTVAATLHNLGTDYRDQLQAALNEADGALGGDSNDAEHDTLYSIRETIARMLGTDYDPPSPDDDKDDEGSPREYDGYVILGSAPGGQTDYEVRLESRYYGRFPAGSIAIYELARAMANTGSFPAAWMEGEHGPSSRLIDDEVRRFHDAGGTGLLPLPGVRFSPGDTVLVDGDGMPWDVVTDYGDLGIMLHASGDPSVTMVAHPPRHQVTLCPEDDPQG